MNRTLKAITLAGLVGAAAISALLRLLAHEPTRPRQPEPGEIKSQIHTAMEDFRREFGT